MSGIPTRKSVRVRKVKEFWVVLQEGGSSGECYGEACETEQEAMKAVLSHQRASYNATYIRVDMGRGITLEQADDVAEAMGNAASGFVCMQQHLACG